MMSDITPEYITAITQEELELERYTVIHAPMRSHRYPYFVSDPVGWEWDAYNEEAAWQAAREHFAPRKMLRELQQRNTALEALVRGAGELFTQGEPVLARIYDGGETRDWVTIEEWQDEAAKLLEGTE